jgi:hypothetical protein
MGFSSSRMDRWSRLAEKGSWECARPERERPPCSSPCFSGFRLLFFPAPAPVTRLFRASAVSVAISMALPAFGAHRRPVNRLYFTGRIFGLHWTAPLVVPNQRPGAIPPRTSVGLGLFCSRPEKGCINFDIANIDCIEIHCFHCFPLFLAWRRFSSLCKALHCKQRPSSIADRLYFILALSRLRATRVGQERQNGAMRRNARYFDAGRGRCRPRGSRRLNRR